MWYNNFMIVLLKSPLHGLISKNILLLTYTGSKSGKTYRLPVNYIPVGDSLLVTSSRTRTWWRSLRKGAPVSLQLRGLLVQAQAQAVEDTQEVAAAFGDLFAVAPQMARYFDVRLESGVKTVQEDLFEAARTRVIVWIRR